MDMENFTEYIEILTENYNKLLYSQEYSRGLALSEYINAFKNKDINKIKFLLTNKWASIKAKKYIKIKDNIDYSSKSKIDINKYSNKKIVVYTCILGSYDYIKEPICDYQNIDYVCFTNNMNFNNTKWKRRDIPKNIKFKSDILINRYIKMHPYEFFSEYDYAFYVDGNIRICSYIGSYIEKINNKTGLAMYSHSSRDCIYDEAIVCKLYKKGNKKFIDSQMKKYKTEGFPNNFGLYEATIIGIDLKNKIGENILSDWWNEFFTNCSLRDQLSLPYIIWKRNLNFSDLGILGENIFKDRKISVYQHKR